MMKILRATCTLLSMLVCASSAVANNDQWNNLSGGLWSTGGNWLDLSTPGTGDSATFGLNGAYTVSFNANPALIQALDVTTDNVTFASVGGTRVLAPTTSFGGTGTATIYGGATLALGTLGNRMELDPVFLNVGNGAGTSQLSVNFGSLVMPSNLNVGQAGDGTLVVDGFGSVAFTHFVDTYVGLNGHAGQINFRNSASGNLSINTGLSNSSVLHLADSNVAGTTAVMTVESDADLTVGGISLASSAGPWARPR